MNRKDAIEVIKKNWPNSSFTRLREALETLIPELAESEDENIRKWIRKELESKYVVDNIVNSVMADKAFAWLTKQDEQNHTDSIKPKFNVDDWIVNNGHSYLIGYIDYEQRRYLFEIGGYTHEPLNWEYIENADNKYHLWTIQDAKDGDVLRIKNVTFIFLEITNDNVSHKDAVVAHCSYEDNDDAFGVSGPDCITDLELVTPATKEQRNLLFQKMKKAGYEWEEEKKELKKIENEIEIHFGAKDSELQEAIYYIPKGFHAEIDDNKVVIKKDKKPITWSEEDEKIIDSPYNGLNKVKEE